MRDTVHDAQGDSAQSRGEVPQGVPAGWSGRFDAYCDLMGIGDRLAEALLKSLKSDPAFIEISQRQRFLTAELGWTHLRKIAGGE